MPRPKNMFAFLKDFPIRIDGFNVQVEEDPTRAVIWINFYDPVDDVIFFRSFGYHDIVRYSDGCFASALAAAQQNRRDRNLDRLDKLENICRSEN